MLSSSHQGELPPVSYYSTLTDGPPPDNVEFRSRQSLLFHISPNVFILRAKNILLFCR